MAPVRSKDEALRQHLEAALKKQGRHLATFDADFILGVVMDHLADIEGC